MSATVYTLVLSMFDPSSFRFRSMYFWGTSIIILNAAIRSIAVTDSFGSSILILYLGVSGGCLQLFLMASINLLFAVTVFPPSGVAMLEGINDNG